MSAARVARLVKLTDTASDNRLDALSLLDLLKEIEQEAGNAQQALVDAMRDAGHAWSAIGTAVGTSKQAAQQRYGHNERTQDEEATPPMF